MTALAGLLLLVLVIALWCAIARSIFGGHDGN
jgi:hypothetical protein